jgi:hypothetical protein
LKLKVPWVIDPVNDNFGVRRRPPNISSSADALALCDGSEDYRLQRMGGAAPGARRKSSSNFAR